VKQGSQYLSGNPDLLLYGGLFGRVLGTRTDLVFLERQRSRLATKTSVDTTSIT
jgi:hypothetical protein